MTPPPHLVRFVIELVASSLYDNLRQFVRKLAAALGLHLFKIC